MMEAIRTQHRQLAEEGRTGVTECTEDLVGNGQQWSPIRAREDDCRPASLANRGGGVLGGV